MMTMCKRFHGLIKQVLKGYHDHRVRFLLYFSMGVIFIIGIVPLLHELSMPQKNLNIVTAKTEIIEIIPENPTVSSIPIISARLKRLNDAASGTDDKGECVSNAIFRPSSGARERMARSGDLLVVSITGHEGTPAGVLIDDNGTTTYRDKVQISFDRFDRDCPSVSSIRLPIAGQVILGNDYSSPTAANEPSLTLTEGSVDIYGRAHAFFIFSFFFEDTLFPATKISLPAGSRLQDCDGTAAWWGYADVKLYNDPDKSDGIINFMATTDSSRLALSFPGGVKAMEKGTGICSADIMPPDLDTKAVSKKNKFQSMGKRVDLIEMSFITRILGSPYLSITWVVVTFMIIFVQTLSAIHTLPNTDKKSSTTEKTSAPSSRE